MSALSMVQEKNHGTVNDSNILAANDEMNPFDSIVACADLFSDDAPKCSSDRRLPRPDWGIPSFIDQCNGINTFTLFRRDEQGQIIEKIDEAELNSVTVALEHRRHSTGSDLWEAALVLAYALDRPVPATVSSHDIHQRQASLFQDAHTVIELGSGTGALGLYAAHVLGARAVLLTDLDPNLTLLRKNRDWNAASASAAIANSCSPNVVVEVMALDWTNEVIPQALTEWKLKNAAKENEGVDLILGSDLFLPFAAHLLRPLARTIRDLLRQFGHSKSQAILAYEERFDCSYFDTYAQEYRLAVDRIDNNWLHPKYRDPGRIHVLRIHLLE